MKIYTKTGDDGTTGLFSGKRVLKCDNRVELYGTVDELNSIIGISTTMDMPKDMLATFENIRHMLFNLGSDFATPLEPKSRFEPKRIDNEDVNYLEHLIDDYDAKLPPLRNFILPGGTQCAAFLHQARTVCRRAERLAVALSKEELLSQESLIFLNRLSDFLFIASRMANFLAGVEDITWKV